MSAFHQGAHQYRGASNSRARRLLSKVGGGIRPIRASTWKRVFGESPLAENSQRAPASVMPATTK
jgi:hypothetical protein